MRGGDPADGTDELLPGKEAVSVVLDLEAVLFTADTVATNPDAASEAAGASE